MKNIHIWLGSYLRQELKRFFANSGPGKPAHVMFCFVDHFEPGWNGADAQTQSLRIRKWEEAYPALADHHRDADGCRPKHTFFYPAECYTADHLDRLARLCRQGYGEVEIHLHHDGDTEESLRGKLTKAKNDFVRHGLLARNRTDHEVKFGFIHGNWALNNSRKDGRWCGVNDESRLLSEVGCYADFTLPSAPSDTQTRKINSIYYDCGGTNRPKSHNTGVDARVGTKGEGLLIVQGPLCLNWKDRKYGIFPRIENSDVTGVNPPTGARVDRWARQRIGVKGRPDWIFIKIHTHGAVEKNSDILLGSQTDSLFSCLEKTYNDGKDFILHYVTARELVNIVKAAESGAQGDPGIFRDQQLILNMAG